MVRSVAIAALVVAAQFAIPAGPATGSGWHGQGEPCSLVENPAAASGEATWAGVLAAGPYAVTDDAGRPASTVVIFCVLQAESDVPETNVVRTTYGPPMPGAGYLPPRDYSLSLEPETRMFLCTGLWIRLPDGTYVHAFDDVNPMRAGTQCPLAFHVDT